MLKWARDYYENAVDLKLFNCSNDHTPGKMANEC